MNPFTELNTLFLDAGNTILFMDYEFLSAELETLGARVAPERLARAEAAARPFVSKHVANRESTKAGGSTEAGDTRQVYVRKILEVACKAESGNPTGEFIGGRAGNLDSVSSQMLERFMDPGFHDLLWSQAPPGIPEALHALREAAVGLTVVSNADGTVFQKLERCGLTQYFDHVVDSGLEGVEKPDPGIFEIALERSKASREHTLHVGDLYHVDVIGAQRAGLRAVLLDPFDDWTEFDCHKSQSVVELSNRILDCRA